MASQNGTLGEVVRALVGVTFPAGKDDLVEFAHRSHSNEGLVHLIAQLPDRKYATLAKIEEALVEVTRTPPSGHRPDSHVSESPTQRDTSSEHLEKISPMPPDQREAVQENQRSVESALDPEGLPQSEHYAKRSGARPTEEN